MTASSYDYKKDFHFVIVGTVKGESKEVALEILKTMTKNKEEIRDKRTSRFWENSLEFFFTFNNDDSKYPNGNIY